MPTLSVFFGIIVTMYKENTAKHKTPHLHARYSSSEVVVALSGEVLEGALPANKMSLLAAWIEIHREDLLANWSLLSQGEQHFKIDPLR